MLSKLFIFSAVILISIVILFSYDKNPINKSNNDYKFWSAPEEDALILFFRFSDELEVDSLFAGQIQFRLDCARTVDKELDSIFAMRSWELGVLLLGVSDDLYNNFNPETYRFNYQPIDSLLDCYNVLGGKKLSGFSGTYAVKLEFSITRI